MPKQRKKDKARRKCVIKTIKLGKDDAYSVITVDNDDKTNENDNSKNYTTR